jgi:hypothetical protein
MAILRTAAPYVVESLSPLFERLDIFVNLLLVIGTNTRRDKGVREATGRFLLIIVEESTLSIRNF